MVLAAPAAGQAPGIDELLSRVGARIASFYERAQYVVALETSTVQPIDSGYSNAGFARTVESELRVEKADGVAPGEAQLLRNVLKVNGRPPRERDKKDRSGCTDPNPLADEPLAFLLPAHREEYQFRYAGVGRDRDRRAFLIDFASVNRTSTLELIEDAAGHDDCFDWAGHLAARGRVWVDAANYDVVRVDQSLPGLVDVRVPARLQRRHGFENHVTLARQDTTIRYRTVTFSDPDEVLLLPESIDILVLTRGGLQSTRRRQTYSGYSRFVSAVRVIE